MFWTCATFHPSVCNSPYGQSRGEIAPIPLSTSGVSGQDGGYTRSFVLLNVNVLITAEVKLLSDVSPSHASHVVCPALELQCLTVAQITTACEI